MDDLWTFCEPFMEQTFVGRPRAISMIWKKNTARNFLKQPIFEFFFRVKGNFRKRERPSLDAYIMPRRHFSIQDMPNNVKHDLVSY